MPAERVETGEKKADQIQQSLLQGEELQRPGDVHHGGADQHDRDDDQAADGYG